MPIKTETAPINKDKIYYLNSFYSRLAKFSYFNRFFWHLGQLLKPTAISQIKSILKQEKPDLVITHNLLGLGWRLPLIIRNLQIEHHHVLHDIQLLHPSGLLLIGQEKIIDYWPSKIYQFFIRYNFRFVQTIISPSNWLLKLHQQRNFFSSAETKINRPQPSVSKIIWPPQLKKFLFIGQLEKHKGLLFLLDCAQTWLKQGRDYQLSIVGDGSLSSIVKSASDNNKKINFLGKLNHKEILTQLKNHDCLIIPSLCHENSPTVIFEANQVGVPTIATAVGGIPELAIDFNLRLFPPGDAETLSKYLFN